MALARDAELVAEWPVPGEENYSTVLLPTTVRLLEAHGLSIDAIEAYAVTAGPGSFTGLRVGISTIQGLALASGRPCVGLSALDVLASRVKGEGSCLVSLMDAYRDEVYAALYDAEANLLEGPGVGPLEAWLGRVPEDAVFTGDGARRYEEAIRAARPGARFPERPPQLAAALARAAAGVFRAGGGHGAAALRPFYLREATVRGAQR